MLRNYLSIARFDHATKHIFIIPGIVLSLLLIEDTFLDPLKLLFGLFSAIMIASANYTINEYLDAPFDKHHPKKYNRPAAKGLIKPLYMYLQYFSFILLGIISGINIGIVFITTLVIFISAGLLYNVKPFRFKNMPYIDVVCESLNNPIRLMIGWSIISNTSIAPISIMISYWFGGAFLMTAKRLSELRYMKHNNMLVELTQYRPTFKHYTENSLIIALFIYAMLSSFNIGIFLIKYRSEYIFLFPTIVTLFAYYLFLTLKDNSIVQTPELLFKDKGLIATLLISVILFIILSITDINLIGEILNSKIPHFKVYFFKQILL
jgi:4-hydroxybenzoate polyprenyltransferase